MSQWHVYVPKGSAKLNPRS